MSDDAAERCVDAVAQILSNYLAALHIASPRGNALAPVRDACDGLPALAELVEEAIAATTSEQVAATHSRLLRRRPALTQATAPETTAARLEELERTSHSAGALFNTLR